MGGGEVHVLLLCHLGLNSWKSIFFIYEMKVTILFLTNVVGVQSDVFEVHGKFSIDGLYNNN